MTAATSSSGVRAAKVLFPLPFNEPFDYLIEDNRNATYGAFVRAPLGPRTIWGVLWPTDNEKIDVVDETKLKTILEIAPESSLSDDTMDFITWTANYTLAPIGSVLRMVMRSGDGIERPPMRRGFRLGRKPPARLTPARKAVLAAAGNDYARTAKNLATAAGVSDAVVRGLAKTGALIAEPIDPDPPFTPPDISLHGKPLNKQQSAASKQIQFRIQDGGPSVTLIDGVTGSGKTEVYLEAVATALANDETAQIAILIPEIALTVPFLRRVEERFGATPAPWHSELTGAQRRRTWRRVADGSARLVVGARSTLFLPYQNLRLIIVDEEHDGAYKQEDGVIYQARDLAVARGAKSRFPVILASATPSLETVMNVGNGRYDAVGLSERYAEAAMPKLTLIDLRTDGGQSSYWLSPRLAEAVDQRLARSEQSLLFLNRRGYAPLTICRRCGHRMTAPNSDTCLVEHRFSNRLVCHHTGFSMEKPTACPACNAVDSLAPCGPGVERVFEEAKHRWPDARISILSSDAAPTATAMRAVLDDMAAGDIDILIATQIAAKGHHFPNLTLVGVVDADLGLSGGDLRAAERTYQLLSQVAGRAGRASKSGEAMLQTHHPEAAVFQALAADDREAFIDAEAHARAAHGAPPFGRLASVILRSTDEKALEIAAKNLRLAAPRGNGVAVMGPARAPIYRLRGVARMRFLVKTRRDVNIQAYLRDWLGRVKETSKVRRTIDIDPYSFL